MTDDRLQMTVNCWRVGFLAWDSTSGLIVRRGEVIIRKYRLRITDDSSELVAYGLQFAGGGVIVFETGGWDLRGRRVDCLRIG